VLGEKLRRRDELPRSVTKVGFKGARGKVLLTLELGLGGEKRDRTDQNSGRGGYERNRGRISRALLKKTLSIKGEVSATTGRGWGDRYGRSLKKGGRIARR